MSAADDYARKVHEASKDYRAGVLFRAGNLRCEGCGQQLRDVPHRVDGRYLCDDCYDGVLAIRSGR